MKNITFERRSLELTPDQWAVLEALADMTDSLAPTGPHAGLPAWRTLVKRIADGDLTLTPAPAWTGEVGGPVVQ